MLGHGSNGRVVLGMNTETGELMAVKQINIASLREIHIKDVRTVFPEWKLIFIYTRERVYAFFFYEQNEGLPY